MYVPVTSMSRCFFFVFSFFFFLQSYSFPNLLLSKHAVKSKHTHKISNARKKQTKYLIKCKQLKFLLNVYGWFLCTRFFFNVFFNVSCLRVFICLVIDLQLSRNATIQHHTPHTTTAKYMCIFLVFYHCVWSKKKMHNNNLDFVFFPLFVPFCIPIHIHSVSATFKTVCLLSTALVNYPQNKQTKEKNVKTARKTSRSCADNYK